MCVHMMVHACMRAHITVYYGSYKLYVDVKLVVAIHNYGDTVYHYGYIRMYAY